MDQTMTTLDPKTLAQELRGDILRMTHAAKSGHPGGSLSIADVLAVLYARFLSHRPAEPDWPDRDRLVLSKGHAAPALYSAMARTGYFPVEQLLTLRKLGSPLQGHPDRLRLPGIEASTGSLGQGLSMAIGMALAARMDRRDSHVWCLLGDGELQEGQVWEAAMSAPKFKLGNLTAIVDLNGYQIDGSVSEVMDIEPIADKFRAFRWEVCSINGHDLAQIEEALRNAKKRRELPLAILARTVKGKGVSFMEGGCEWHGKAPNSSELAQALEEVSRG
ncbi:MAG: transketolase [Elusimicrobia bacterium GWA2_69_24]|nr:MAG: transketolase [Elusimicrobia bacterium GWA2_69_24]